MIVRKPAFQDEPHDDRGSAVTDTGSLPDVLREKLKAMRAGSNR